MPKTIVMMSAAVAFCVATLAMTSVNAHGPSSPSTGETPQPHQKAETLAEIAYPDAPHGVDPMVTGPRTAAFKDRQNRAGCASAQWPNIPLDCYPN